MRRALGPRLRPALKVWHRWFGLLGGLWLLLLAVTGCAITYYQELDGWLNPDLHRAPLSAVAAPLDRVVDRAEAALPGFAPSIILLPAEPGGTIWMLGRAPVDDGDMASVQLFADPGSGKILGWRESGRIAFDRRHAMDILYGLHVDLLAGPWATWFFGLVSLFWLLDHVAAVALAFPRGAAIREAFAVAGRKGSLRRLFDQHRAWGLWLLPVTFVLALTGVTLAWPEDSRHAVEHLSPITGRLHEEWPEVDPPAAPIDIDRAVAIAAPDERVHSVRILAHQGVYAVRTYDPQDPDYQGRLWTYVGMDDGRILGRRHDNGTTAGDIFFAWQYPLHSGQALGEFGRALIFAGGLVTAWLTISGVRLWWRRRRRARARQPA